MRVINRAGQSEPVSFDKILARITRLCDGLDPLVDPVQISQKVIDGLKDNITTQELDTLAAETAAYQMTRHPDFGTLASRIAISNLHKQTKRLFSECVNDLYHFAHPKLNRSTPLVSEELYNIVMNNKETIDNAIVHERDYSFSYFGFKTLERSYLLKIDNHVAERPQYMFMRVALGLHSTDLTSALETYHLMSQKFFIHATPTLFNFGTPRPSGSSCFVLNMKSDSVDGIYDTLKNCALISKAAGGIGFDAHKIRATDSYIAGTGGQSNGLVPMLKVYNNTAKYIDQGGNKRCGSFAAYLEPWHADIFEFLNLKKNSGSEEHRARDLFYALWIPNLFMKRVEEDGDWTLMCPNECPGLHEVYGEQFEKLYETYEKTGRGRKTIKAQVLWKAIMDSHIETGTPYMLYKDYCNQKSNQKNLGTIKSSNLCCEIIEYTAPDEVAVCNLASIGLPKYVENNTFNFQKLFEVVKIVTKNLNKVIDRTLYPIPEAKYSNFRHRPIGIGVQGLADVFVLLRMPFDSADARQLNRQIFETIYYGALTASCELAQQDGTYETYENSPVSQGVLQYDMWDVTPTKLWDWDGLKRNIKSHGVRNSLLIAPMPTASTSQILGFNECFEPFTSNIYARRVLAGEFQLVNHYLISDLQKLGMWDNAMRNQIIADSGSVQHIKRIPQHIKDLYKTVWEISQKVIIDMAADRGAFVDQSQSMNIFIAEPTYGKLTSMHFYAWKKGLKTGMYYLRTKPATTAIKFTVDKSTKEPAEEEIVCRKEAGCVVCSS